MHNSNFANIVLKTAIIFILIFVSLNKIYAQLPTISNLDSSISVDKIVLQEFNAISNFYRKYYALYKTNQETKANKNFQILINTRSLLELSQSFDTSQLKWIVTLVIAHEFFHLVQFEKYNRPIKQYEFKLFESQADILAGEYLSRRIVALRIYDSISPDRHDYFKNKIFNDSYRFFFKIGTNTYAMEDHPDKNQRTMSVVRGALLGELELFNDMSLDRTQPDKIDFKKLITNSKEKLDILSNNMTLQEKLDWSYDQAKMIVHGDPENLVDIVKRNETMSKKYDSLYIHNLEFKNIGKDTLTFKFEDRLGKSPRDSSFEFDDDFFFFENHYYTITLYPHESKIIADTCYLNHSPISALVTYVSPPSHYSLFYCITNKKDVPSTADESRNLFTATIDSNYLPNYMLSLIDGSDLQNCSKLIANMGTCFPENSNFIVYNGIAPPNSKFTCTLNRTINGDWFRISLHLGYFENDALADTVFNYYCKQFSVLYGKPLKSTGRNGKKWTVFHTSHSVIHVSKFKMRLLELFDDREEPVVKKVHSKLIDIEIYNNFGHQNKDL